jgi:magnesium-transporting ATPase (P-type)
VAPEARGLDSAEASRRLARVGPNEIRRRRGPRLLRRLLAQFTHLMAGLLWAAAGIAWFAGLGELAVAIVAVNLVNGAFSFWQEYRAERATAALTRLIPLQARVVRDGVERSVPAEELVPGDLLLLAEGDRISADARLLESASLQVDESLLTGESEPVAKDPAAAPDLHAGTSVASGHGTALVVETGMRTRLGQVAHLTEAVQEVPSPLQLEMAHVTRTVTLVAVGFGLAFGGLALLATPMAREQAFVFALGMIVAFVPEGLLPTVTMALALGVQRMARRRALVKRLSAVETLGCTTVICTDKTGTLTRNQMTVRAIWLAGGERAVSGGGLEPGGAIEGPPDEDRQRLLLAAAACGNARLAEDAEGRLRALGDPTEAALLVLAAKGGVTREAAEARLPRVGELAFDASRRRMTTLHRVPGGGLAFTKGAPEALLLRCRWLRSGGALVPFDAERREQTRAWIEAHARQGHRVLALAQRTLPEEAARGAEGVERDLELLGLAALLDPPRPDAAEAVARCRSAGIRVVMITGDHALTAERIGRDVGLWSGEPPRIVEGPELEAMSEDELCEALAREVLFARASPEHKLRVVRSLQAAGHVVAVTGDGVNDAPALEQADIGVAMGASGTDVAREAADIVLADDHFASIVNAVEEGRAVYANIRRFTTYIFTSNAPEAVPFLVHAFSGGRVPLALGIMQILAVDLGTDLVPALALGAEPAEPGVMERPPRRRGEHLISGRLLLRAYGWLGPIQAAAAMAGFFVTWSAAGFAGRWLELPAEGEAYRAATSATLAVVVATQIGNLFAQRSRRVGLRAGLRANPLLLAGVASEFALLLAIVHLPPLQRVFGTAPPPALSWAFAAASAPLLWVAEEARVRWLRRRAQRPRARAATRAA